MRQTASDTTGLDTLDDPIPADPARRSSGVQARAVPRETSDSAPVAQQPRPLISIGSAAEPALLEPTYAYLSAYAMACLPPRMAQRLNVAIYELYANALSYGARTGEVRLELEPIENGGVRLRVANQVDPVQLERLRAQIARVALDPSAAFSTEMNRFAVGSQPPPMLGLVRVAHECALRLELRCEGERVELATVCEAEAGG